jgi:hypothetical protein
VRSLYPEAGSAWSDEEWSDIQLAIESTRLEIATDINLASSDTARYLNERNAADAASIWNDNDTIVFTGRPTTEDELRRQVEDGSMIIFGDDAWNGVADHGAVVIDGSDDDGDDSRGESAQGDQSALDLDRYRRAKHDEAQERVAKAERHERVANDDFTDFQLERARRAEHAKERAREEERLRGMLARITKAMESALPGGAEQASTGGGSSQHIRPPPKFPPPRTNAEAHRQAAAQYRWAADEYRAKGNAAKAAEMEQCARAEERKASGYSR